MSEQYRELTEAVVQHIEHEHHVLGRTSENAPDVLASMFIEKGAETARALRNVTFTSLCPVMGKKAIHAILSTDSGPVEMIFIPDISIPEVRDTLQDGLTNHLVPMGDGVMILSSDSPIPFNEVSDGLQRAVEWEI